MAVLQRASSKRVPPLAATSTPAITTPPTDAVPQQGSRPSEVLIHRLDELKRITKSLAAYFEQVAASHHLQGKLLLAQASSDVIQSPFPESQLFLPTPVPAGQEGGWADLLVQIREGARVSGEEHQALAKHVQENVVALLKNLRLAVKGHITDLDKAVSSLCDEVVKEREASTQALTHLATAIAHHESTPDSITAEEDPLVVRYTAEGQMRSRVIKENEALTAALVWQDKTKHFEAELLESIRFCWNCYETEHAKLLASEQQRSAAFATRINAAEWAHFQRLNLLIPADTPTRSLDAIEFPNRDHPATLPVKSGILQRKKRYVKNYKEAFFVLSTAGYLHEYPSSDTSLDKPHLSLYLPHCTLGSMPSAAGNKNGRLKFTLEGRQSATSGTFKGSLKMQHKELGRTYSARSWEELRAWWTELEKFTKGGAGALAVEQGPAPLAVQRAGLPAETEEEAAITRHAGALTTDEEMGGSSDEEFEEAETSLGASRVAARKEGSAEKPGYIETPGVVSGGARDLKVQTGAARPAAENPIATISSGPTMSDPLAANPAATLATTSVVGAGKPLTALAEPPHTHTKEATSTSITSPTTQERAASIMVDTSAAPPQQPPAMATRPLKKKRSSWLPFKKS